jgi:hypothetical protein
LQSSERLGATSVHDRSDELMMNAGRTLNSLILSRPWSAGVASSWQGKMAWLLYQGVVEKLENGEVTVLIVDP